MENKQGMRRAVSLCVCKKTLYFCLLSGECCVIFLAPTYQSGPAGMEQSSVGKKGVS